MEYYSTLLCFILLSQQTWCQRHSPTSRIIKIVTPLIPWRPHMPELPSIPRGPERPHMLTPPAIPDIEKLRPGVDAGSLNVVHQWRELEFLFPNASARNNSISNGVFVPGASLPIDVDVHYTKDGKPRVFVSTPRFQRGRAFTLATVVTGVHPGPNGPQLAPYPDFSWNANPTNCSGLTSIFRVAIDKCNRLWMVDSGRLGTVQLCPPEILAFNLTTDKLLHRHEINPTLYRGTSVFVTPAVDVRDDSCADTFVYIADVTGFGMIVYDHARNESWRAENKLFYPFPTRGTHIIGGQQFELMDGIIGMSISPWNRHDPQADRTVFFHALASTTQNRVLSSTLRNRTNFAISPRSVPEQFLVYPDERSSQSVATAIDRNGIMYFGLNGDLSMACWDTKKPYSNISIIVKDPEILQFASGVKIVINHRGEEELWLMTCSFQKYITNTLTNSTVNFRILRGNPRDLVKGTLCE